MNEEAMATDPIQEVGGVYHGLGVEVWWAISGITSIVMALLIMWWFRITSPSGQDTHEVHPEQQQLVDEVRRRLAGNNTQQEAPNGVDGHIVDNLQCAVCLDNMSYPVATNCGHMFCARCVMEYWRADRWPRACRCPVCRRDITLLMPDGRHNLEERNNRLFRDVVDYNRKMAGHFTPASVASYLCDIPTILVHMVHTLFSANGMVMTRRLYLLWLILMMLLYIFIPMDILPESVLGVIGLIDDLFLLVIFILYITHLYRSYFSNHNTT